MSEKESEETTSTPEPNASLVDAPRDRFGLVDWVNFDVSGIPQDALLALAEDHNERVRAMSPEQLKELDLEKRESRRSDEDLKQYERTREKAENVFYGSESGEVKMQQLERLLRLFPDHADVLGYMEGVSMEMSDGPSTGPTSLDDASFSLDMPDDEAMRISQEDEEKIDEEDE